MNLNHVSASVVVGTLFLAAWTGCGESTPGDNEGKQRRATAVGPVPSRSAQLFLTDRVCRTLINAKNRPGFNAALIKGDWSVINEARRDLTYTGKALERFPLPEVPSVASGHLKVAGATSRRALAKGLRYPFASVEELRQAANRVGLPSCAIR